MAGFLDHVHCFTATSLGNVARAVADLSFFREASLLASDWFISQWRVISRADLSVEAIKLKSIKIVKLSHWKMSTELVDVMDLPLDMAGE